MANTPKPIKLRHSNSAAQHFSRSKPSHFFSKFFIIVLLLLAIPLFPSHPPQFSSVSTFFTKLWEPLQLLFVGLAVCYGLFCKRSSSDLELDTFSVNGKNEASDLCSSGISSFFEDGFQNSCGYDEKKVILKSGERFKLDEGNGGGSLSFVNGSSKKDDLIGEKITKSWNSQHFRGESVVGVAHGDCVVDEWDAPLSKSDYKPLNLPVRSLRSNIVVPDKYEENVTTEDNFSAEGPRKIRGVRPINLEKKFEEVSSPAPVSWQMRSPMMEANKLSRRHGESSHLRPHSAGEFDFEHLKLRSSQYPLSCSTSSKSSSLGELSPTRMKLEDVDRDIDLKRSHVKVSEHRIASEAPFMVSKRLHSSFGSSLDMTVQRSKKERLKETNIGAKDEIFNGEREGPSSVNIEVKPEKIARVLPRGKSVRTIRSSKIVPFETRGSNTGESDAGEVYGKIQDSAFLNEDESHENSEIQKKLNIDDHFPGQVLGFPESKGDDKQDLFEASSITTEDNSEGKSESYPSSSDEEVPRSDIDGSEVDRKAGEFIAKFREQIRLQKLALVKRHGHTEVS